jgi:hypothetical protein
VLKLLALAFHFSSDRNDAIDPHAGRMLQGLIGDNPPSDEIVSLTLKLNSSESDSTAQTLPAAADHHKRAA